MFASLTRFKVVGLHAQQTMDVHIQDNKLVLVGENGTGKSTFVNLIYYFLTKQWRRLHDYRFASIEAVLGGQDLRITPEQIDTYFAVRQQMNLTMRRFPIPTARSRAVISRFLDFAHDNPVNSDWRRGW